jgi:hypothetical protein
VTEHLRIPGYITARQAAKELGVSEARIRKLASIYGWENCTIELTKLFSTADVYRYIKARQYFRQLNDVDRSKGQNAPCLNKQSNTKHLL